MDRLDYIEVRDEINDSMNTHVQRLGAGVETGGLHRVVAVHCVQPAGARLAVARFSGSPSPSFGETRQVA